MYKRRPPVGGEGSFKIVDENGHGGRGRGSGGINVHLHQDLQKYNFDNEK